LRLEWYQYIGRGSSVPLISARKGTDPPPIGSACVPHTSPHGAAAATSVTSLRWAHWLASDFHSWINSWIDCQTNQCLHNLTVNPTVQPTVESTLGPTVGPAVRSIFKLCKCNYVSWKTTGYYRKDSLKLAARCPVSGCWPSCLCLSQITLDLRVVLELFKQDLLAFRPNRSDTF